MSENTVSIVTRGKVDILDRWYGVEALFWLLLFCQGMEVKWSAVGAGEGGRGLSRREGVK